MTGNAGTTTVTVTCPSFKGRLLRTDTIKLNSVAGGKTATVAVTQHAAEGFVTYVKWTVNGNTYTVKNDASTRLSPITAAAQTVKVVGKSNRQAFVDFTLGSLVTLADIKINGTSIGTSLSQNVPGDPGATGEYDYECTFNIAANTGAARNITFCINAAYPSYDGTNTGNDMFFTLSQAAGYALSVNKSSLTFKADGTPTATDGNKFNVTAVGTGWTIEGGG